MPHPELSPLGEPRNTPQALIDLYKRLAAPLDADAIRTIVEPFTSSSFADIIIYDLRAKIQSNPGQKPAFTGNDIYLSLFHKITDTNIDDELKGIDKDIAELAVQSHLSHAVSIDLIYPDYRLAPGEMALWQVRHDRVWHDPDHTREAFIHSVGEWRLYKDGKQLGSIPMQTLQFQDARNKLQFPTFIAEGSPDLIAFHDPRIQGVGGVAPQLQKYDKHYRMLFVSEQFDFDVCVRK